jgi:hypothetical protein
MKQDQNPETPNVCNNCVKPEKKPVDEISILIKCDAATQKVIEEICINQGVSFSQYFLALHGLNLIDLKMGEQKTQSKPPEGFVEITSQEQEDTPKKRGRPFKIVDK